MCKKLVEWAIKNKKINIYYFLVVWHICFKSCVSKLEIIIVSEWIIWLTLNI